MNDETLELITLLKAQQRDKYKVVECREGIIVTSHPDYGKQVWTSANLRGKHRNDECAMCGKIVGSPAYLPITNMSNRSARICCAHNEKV